MNASLTIRPFDTLVIGKVDFTFKTLGEDIDSIVFSASELKISEIKINDQVANFKMKDTDV